MVIPKLIVLGLMGGALTHSAVLVLDVVIGSLIEKRRGVWPITTYYCVCGYTIKDKGYLPLNIYKALKALEHNRTCLARLMCFSGREISLKWQNYACEEILRRGRDLSYRDWISYENLTRADQGLPRLPFNPDECY